MDDRDGKRSIHFNPQFIAPSVESRVNAKVHVNPAFFHKQRSSQDGPMQACPPVITVPRNNLSNYSNCSSYPKQAYAKASNSGTYSWRNTNLATNHVSVITPSDGFRNAKRPSTSGSSTFSKYNYQFPCVGKDSMRPVTSLARDKYKVDNRTKAQVINEGVKTSYKNLCDVNKNYSSTTTSVSSGKPLGLEVNHLTKVSEAELLKRNFGNQDRRALQNSSDSVSFGSEFKSLNNYKLTSAGTNFAASNVAKGTGFPPNKSRDDFLMLSETTNSVVKDSNILINPALLKSLSNTCNKEINILPHTSQLSPQKNLYSEASKNLELSREKIKERSTVSGFSAGLASNYKVLSKTKLVRRRSRSFSKCKTKSFTKEKPVTLASSPYLKKQEGVSITLCRPSPIFPTRPHTSALTKLTPKKHYAVLSKNKLIRRLSRSSSTTEESQEKPDKYSVKTKTKLVKRLPLSSLKSSKMVAATKMHCKKLESECKKNYAVLSRTKLIRRRSHSGMLKNIVNSKEFKPNSKSILQCHKIMKKSHGKSSKVALPWNSSMKLVRRVNTKYKIENRGLGVSVKQKAAKGIVTKYRINRLKVESSPIVKRTAKGIVTKYRINRLKVESSPFVKRTTKGIVTKYRINRLKVESHPIVKRTSRGKFTWVSSRGKTGSQRKVHPVKTGRNMEKFSDRFVNIGGILYKATQMSLQKQATGRKKINVSAGRKNSECIVKLRGNEYRVSAGGRTLTRVQNKSVPSATPLLSRVHIGGLTYSRTKKGHYELTKAHQARAVLSSAKHRSMYTLCKKRKKSSLQRRNQYCIFFNRFGRCNKRDKGDCPYLHDPAKVAVCTRFLRGRCPVSNCPFSHKIDPDKMPVCSHFVRSICTREDCPYRHVRVNPKAPICLDFLHGHCPSGQECKKQHILECEEFSSSGKCPRGEACPLSHRRGKGLKRKKTRSISLEPVALPSGKEKTSFSHQKRRKTSNSFDVLGSPHVRRNDRPSTKTSNSGLLKRYFQVQEEDVHKNESGKDEDKCADTQESKVSAKLNNVESNNKEILIGSQGISDKEEKIFEIGDSNPGQSLTNLESKRDRLMLKIDKMRDIYDTSMEFQTTTSSSSKGKDQSHVDSAEETLPSSPDFKCDAFQRRPLPKRMPSFISLTKSSGDVEDP